MIGAVASFRNTYPVSYRWQGQAAQRVRRRMEENAGLDKTGRKQIGQSAGESVRLSAVKAPQTGKPVTPVDPVKPVRDTGFDKEAMLNFMASDPVEAAVRSRIQYADGSQNAKTPREIMRSAVQNEDNAAMFAGGPAKGNVSNAAAQGLPVRDILNAAGQKETPVSGAPGQEEDNAVFAAGGKKAEPLLPGAPGQKESGLPGVNAGEKAAEGVSGGEDAVPGVPETGAKSAQEVAEEGECQTCENRKYQDGSDDPGVSFKNPTGVSPEMASSAVRGHENEHVVRERAKAEREGRKVVSQSVTYKTAVCPECGKVYVSGGETRTTTAAASQANPLKSSQSQREQDKEDKRDKRMEHLGLVLNR